MIFDDSSLPTDLLVMYELFRCVTDSVRGSSFYDGGELQIEYGGKLCDL